MKEKAAAVFLLALLAACGKVNGSVISKEKFESVQLGLSYDQVVAVIGTPGTPAPAQVTEQDRDQDIRSFVWRTSKSGNTAAILFEDDKAIEKIPPETW